MFTTDGATCFAICVKVLDSSTGLGMTSGVAPGAALLSDLAALTPEVIRVPITIPTDRVNKISVNESSFCVRNLSKKLMALLTPLRKCNWIHYIHGCNSNLSGFSSTGVSDTPAISMPYNNGRTLLRQLRRGRLKTCPTIALRQRRRLTRRSLRNPAAAEAR